MNEGMRPISPGAAQELEERASRGGAFIVAELSNHHSPSEKTRADGLLSALVESTIGWHYGVKKVIPSSFLVKNRFSAKSQTAHSRPIPGWSGSGSLKASTSIWYLPFSNSRRTFP